MGDAKRRKMTDGCAAVAPEGRGLLCISLDSQSTEDALASMQDQEMAEIRMDLMYPAVKQDGFQKIFASDIPMIATCRDVGGQEGWGPLRKELLQLGITGGATHVDIEVEAPTEWKTEMVALAKKHNVQVIISHHNYDSTPSPEQLQEIVAECFADGADIAKIAVAAQSEQDTARVLALHDDDRPVVMLAMGEKGKISRIAGPLLGAPFTFVAATPETATAPGQLTATQMRGLYAAM